MSLRTSERTVLYCQVLALQITASLVNYLLDYVAKILRSLTINGNRFSGKLPDCLKNCTKLSRVRLEANNLSGNLAEAFGVHPNLVFLSLSDNQFSGELSPDWGDVKISQV